VRLFKHFILEL